MLGDTVNVYRNELKYFINEMDYINLSKVFKTALEKDVYDVNNEGYWIRSLYFDTLQNKDYYEKIIGSIHFTPGQAYEDAFNGNNSGIHWDMVLVQRKEYGGGEIYFDHQLIRKDGLFVLPELSHLNYDLK